MATGQTLLTFDIRNSEPQGEGSLVTWYSPLVEWTSGSTVTQRLVGVIPQSYDGGDLVLRLTMVPVSDGGGGETTIEAIGRVARYTDDIAETATPFTGDVSGQLPFLNQIGSEQQLYLLITLPVSSLDNLIPGDVVVIEVERNNTGVVANTFAAAVIGTFGVVGVITNIPGPAGQFYMQSLTAASPNQPMSVAIANDGPGGLPMITVTLGTDGGGAIDPVKNIDELIAGAINDTIPNYTAYHGGQGKHISTEDTPTAGFGGGGSNFPASTWVSSVEVLEG